MSYEESYYVAYLPRGWHAEHASQAILARALSFPGSSLSFLPLTAVSSRVLLSFRISSPYYFVARHYFALSFFCHPFLQDGDY